MKPEANDHDLRCGTADGGDQVLIASLKPKTRYQLAPRLSPLGNPARRPRRMTRFSTPSVDLSRPREAGLTVVVSAIAAAQDYRSEPQGWVMGWTPPDGICVPR